MKGTCRVIEISRCDCLLYRCDVVGVRVALNDDFHTLAQPGKLITNIARPTQTLILQELLVAELLGVVGVRPLLPNIEQCEVITTRADEVLSGLISVQFLVLGPVEKRGRLGEHSNDGEHLWNRQSYMRHFEKWVNVPRQYMSNSHSI